MRTVKYTEALSGIVSGKLIGTDKTIAGSNWKEAVKEAFDAFGEHNHTADCGCPDCLNAPPNSLVSATSGGIKIEKKEMKPLKDDLKKLENKEFVIKMRIFKQLRERWDAMNRYETALVHKTPERKEAHHLEREAIRQEVTETLGILTFNLLTSAYNMGYIDGRGDDYLADDD